LTSFPAPGGGFSNGFTFDGQYLWLANNSTDMYYQIDIGIHVISDITGSIALEGAQYMEGQIYLIQPGEPVQRIPLNRDGSYEFKRAVSGKEYQVIIEEEGTLP